MWLSHASVCVLMYFLSQESKDRTAAAEHPPRGRSVPHGLSQRILLPGESSRFAPVKPVGKKRLRNKPPHSRPVRVRVCMSAPQGALFVLLQHQSLSSPEGGATETAEEEEEEEKKEEEEEEEEEEKKEEEKAALFSLVAVNPVSGKCALASRLFPPKAWTGR